MNRLLTARLLALVLLATAPAAVRAQVDSDGDGVPNTLETDGYRFDIGTGAFVACMPGADATCVVTDPLSWSSDGDPYSDGQEASGVNMDATVRVPYNSPLVAAYPVIEVALASYAFTPRITITDAAGRTLAQSATFSSSVETTAGVSVTVGAEASWPGGVSASAEATASYSETRAYSSETTSGQELSWETASTVETGDAGVLSLSLFARNSGGATALNVRPTFNIYIGDDLVATVLPDVPFRQSLAPGESSAPVVPLVGGQPLAVTLSFDRLVALQTGAPVRIEVVDILADIQRWRPQDSNWECGSGETCSWTSFQNQILPRTLRLLVDFGYSGDPSAQIPFRFRGNPFEYRVYAGSPSGSAGFTLRDVLRIVRYDLAPVGGSAAIEGRPYPAQWLLTAQADTDGYSPILEAWQAAGQPADLLDVVMPPEATLLMASPDPLDAGPLLASGRLSRDLRTIEVAATPRGSLPVRSVTAYVSLYGVETAVPLAPTADGARWVAAPLPAPVGAAASRVVLTDLSGAVREVADALALPIPAVASCAQMPARYFTNPTIRREVLAVFPSGRLDEPAEAYCDGNVTRFWVPVASSLSGPAGLHGAAFLSDSVAVAVGDRAVLRSADGGRAWAAVPVPGLDAVLFDVARRPDTGTLLAVGGAPSTVLRSTDDGVTWAAVPTGTSRTLRAVTHLAAGTWMATGQDRLMVSTDDGQTWNGAPTPPPAGTGWVGLAFRDAATGILLEAGTGAAGTGRTWRTTDGGQTWTDVLGATGTRDVVYAGDSTWYASQLVGSNRRVVRSREDGARGTWSLLNVAPAGATSPRGLAFATPERGWLADDQGVLATRDGGDTWDFEPRLSGQPRAVAALDANRALLVSSTGLIQLTTSGGGAPWTAPVSDAPTPPDGAPLALGLPYPNPARGRATVPFTLDAPAHVTLAVFDVLGREVARLVDAPLGAGAHAVPFDAPGLAAGTFVVRLTAGGQTATQRMTRIR